MSVACIVQTVMSAVPILRFSANVGTGDPGVDWSRCDTLQDIVFIMVQEYQIINLAQKKAEYGEYGIGSQILL